jgi:large subunit ribosomal protein L7/L12
MSDTTFDAKIKDLGDKLAGLTLKDAVDLGKYMKETYGIEAAAGGGVMMAGGGGGGGGCQGRGEDSFDVILKAVDAAKKIGSSRSSARRRAWAWRKPRLRRRPGKAVKTGLSKEDAEKLKKTLEEAGATVELA